MIGALEAPMAAVKAYLMRLDRRRVINREIDENMRLMENILSRTESLVFAARTNTSTPQDLQVILVLQTRFDVLRQKNDALFKELGKT